MKLTKTNLMTFGRQSLASALSLSMIWTSGNVAQAAALSPSVFVAASDLPQFQLVPPQKLGRIVDYFNADSGATPGKLVVLIQDLHAHYGVQKNIAGLLDFLTQKLSPTNSSSIPFALAVEGAQGPVDTSLMALFPDAKVKEEASQFLMRQAELTGAEYFAIKHGLPNFIVGVENGEFYTLHRDLFRKTIDQRQTLVAALTSIQAGIASLPKEIYGAALKTFQSKITAFERGDLSTEEFIGFLASQVQADTIDMKQKFPTLASFIQNGALGPGHAGLNADQLHQATAEFFTTSSSYLSAEEKKNLSVLAKQSDSTSYYLYVRELIVQHKLFLAVSPYLAAYLEYIHTEQTRGLDRVLHEAHELAFQIKSQLAITKQEKDLVQVEHDLDLLKRIADLQATEEEVRDFAPHLNHFVALCDAMLSSPSSPSASVGDPQRIDSEGIKRLISSSIDYYVMALMRNKPMVEHTLALITDIGEQRVMSNELQTKKSAAARPSLHHKKSHHSTSVVATSPLIAHPSLRNTAVLVAGGFHTTAMTQLLREKNISFIVIAPTVDQITAADHELYVTRLSGKVLSQNEILEKILARGHHTHMQNIEQIVSKLILHSAEQHEGLAVGLELALPADQLVTIGAEKIRHGMSADNVHRWLTDKLATIAPRMSPEAKSAVTEWLSTSQAQFAVGEQPGLGEKVHGIRDGLRLIVSIFNLALALLGLSGSPVQAPREIRDSMALAGRVGRNSLNATTISDGGVSAFADSLNPFFKGLENTEAQNLRQEAVAQNIRFYIVDDPNGAFIRRIGDKIILNSARQELKESTRLTALIHDIIGHDWDFVATIVGPYSASNAHIYEAYALASAEFRMLYDQNSRIERSIKAFATLQILEDSGIDELTPIRLEGTSWELTDHQKDQIRETLPKIFAARKPIGPPPGLRFGPLGNFPLNLLAQPSPNELALLDWATRGNVTAEESLRRISRILSIHNKLQQLEVTPESDPVRLGVQTIGTVLDLLPAFVSKSTVSHSDLLRFIDSIVVHIAPNADMATLERSYQSLIHSDVFKGQDSEIPVDQYVELLRQAVVLDAGNGVKAAGHLSFNESERRMLIDPIFRRLFGRITPTWIMHWIVAPIAESWDLLFNTEKFLASHDGGFEEQRKWATLVIKWIGGPTGALIGASIAGHIDFGQQTAVSLIAVAFAGFISAYVMPIFFHSIHNILVDGVNRVAEILYASKSPIVAHLSIVNEEPLPDVTLKAIASMAGTDAKSNEEMVASVRKISAALQQTRTDHEEFLVEIIPALAQKHPNLTEFREDIANLEFVAESMRAWGHPGHEIFPYLGNVLRWDKTSPGLWKAVLELSTEMAKKKMNPSDTIRYYLKPIVDGSKGRNWLITRSFALAKNLIDQGIDPINAFKYIVPSLATVAADREEVFDQLADASSQFLATLHVKKIDSTEILRRTFDLIADASENGHEWVMIKALEQAKLSVEAGADPLPLLFSIPAIAEIANDRQELFEKLIVEVKGLAVVLHDKKMSSSEILSVGLGVVAQTAKGHEWAFSASVNTAKQLASEGVNPQDFLQVGAPALIRSARTHFPPYAPEIEAIDALQLPPLEKQQHLRAFEEKALNQMLTSTAASLVSLAKEDVFLMNFIEQGIAAIATVSDDRADDFAKLTDSLTTLMQAAHKADVSYYNLGALKGLANSLRRKPAIMNGLLLLMTEMAEMKIHPNRIFSDDISQFLRQHDSPLYDQSILRAIEFGRYLTSKGISINEMPEGFGSLAAIAGMPVPSRMVPIRKEARPVPNWVLDEVLDFNNRTSDIKPGIVRMAVENAVYPLERAAGGDQAKFKVYLQELEALIRSGNIENIEREFFASFNKTRDLLEAQPNAWHDLILPLVASQKRGSPAVLDAIDGLTQHIRSKEEISVLRWIVTSKGVRAVDLLTHFIHAGLISGEIESIATEKELLIEFLQKFSSFAVLDFYKSYKTIRSDGTLTSVEKNRKVEELASSLNTLKEAIVSGKITAADLSNPHYADVLFHVFPPATTISRSNYVSLVRSFPDHPEHTKLHDPDDLQDKTYTFGKSSYQLKSGAEINQQPWQTLKGVVAQVNDEKEFSEEWAQLGKDLLSAWNGGQLAKNKTALLTRLYRQFKRQGLELPKEVDSVNALLSYKEFLGDRVRDLIQDALSAYQKKDADAYEHLVKEKMNPRIKLEEGMAKRILEIIRKSRLASADENKISQETAEFALGKMLATFDISGQDAYAIFSRSNSLSDIKIAMNSMEAGEIAVQFGKESSRIAQDLVGSDVAAMQIELHGGETIIEGRKQRVAGKIEYSTEGSSAQATLRFHVTKRATHAPIAYCEGVCTAQDQELWNSENFLQVPFFSEEDIAMGGTHVLLGKEDDGKTYLALPGINPSVALLGEVDANEVLKAVLDYAERLAKKWNVDEVWVPTNSVIHSNRDQMQTAIKEWSSTVPTRNIASQRFSYAPSYTFDQVFVAYSKSTSTSKDETAQDQEQTGGSAILESTLYTVGAAAPLESYGLLSMLLQAQHLTSSPILFALTAMLVFLAIHLPQLYMGRLGRKLAGKSFLQRLATIMTPDVISMAGLTFVTALLIPGLQAAHPGYAQAVMAALTAVHAAINIAGRSAILRSRLSNSWRRINFIGHWLESRRAAEQNLALITTAEARLAHIPAGVSNYIPTFSEVRTTPLFLETAHSLLGGAA